MRPNCAILAMPVALITIDKKLAFLHFFILYTSMYFLRRTAKLVIGDSALPLENLFSVFNSKWTVLKKCVFYRHLYPIKVLGWDLILNPNLSSSGYNFQGLI